MVQHKLYMYFTYHRMKTYMCAGVTAVVDSAPDHKGPDSPPPRWGDRPGQVKAAFCLSGWSCVERNRGSEPGSERVSRAGAGVDPGRFAWEGETAVRGCGGTCAGRTRRGARFCCWPGGELVCRRLGYSALIDWRHCWSTLPNAPECPENTTEAFHSSSPLSIPPSSASGLSLTGGF